MNKILFDRRNQLIAYILIIFVAPFVMCRYYLQPFIAGISNFSFEFLKLNIPIVPAIALCLFGIVIVLLLRYIDLQRISAFFFIIGIIIISQYLSDFYMGNSFYDIQNNWHYIAYGLFSYLTCKFLKEKKFSRTRIEYYIFAGAALISTIDEFLQMNMTNRVFDPGDIAKDVMGAVLGMFFIFFILEKRNILKISFHRQKIRQYFQQPDSVLILELLFVIFFLFNSSLLTDRQYWITALFLSIFTFMSAFFILHFLKYKPVKILVILIILAQIVSFSIFHSRNITLSTNLITIYKGIPIPYFDLMIFENGSFRLVDKKTYFNNGDIRQIMKFTSDILILGSGEKGNGGKGFPIQGKMDFVFNEQNKGITQILKLKNGYAVRMFNNLKKQNKKVVLILHHE